MLAYFYHNYMDPSWVLTDNFGGGCDNERRQRTSTPRVSNVTASDTSVFATDFATVFATARAGLQQRHDFFGLFCRVFYNQQDPGVMLRKVLGMAVFHRKFDVFLRHCDRVSQPDLCAKRGVCNWLLRHREVSP